MNEEKVAAAPQAAVDKPSEIFEVGNSKIDIDALYRIRASANIPNLTFSPTHMKQLPWSIHRSNMPVKAVAYCGNNKIAEYLSKINELADMVINLTVECKKLRKENERHRKLLFGA